MRHSPLQIVLEVLLLLAVSLSLGFHRKIGGSYRFPRTPLPRGFGVSLQAGRSGKGKRGPTSRAWRLYNIEVLLDRDPGKNHLSLHPNLLESLAKELKMSKTDRDELDNALIEEGEEKVDNHDSDSDDDKYKVSIVRKSFDGRWKKTGQPKFVYTLDVRFPSMDVVKRLRLKSVNGRADPLFSQPVGQELLEARSMEIAPRSSDAKKQARKGEKVIVVGAGPAGLFAAIELIKGGYSPIIIERGQAVEQRGRDIGALFNRKILNKDSNLCYGEGGAGTWSDGKLATNIGKNSEAVREVLKILVRHGAPESILAAGKPHLGTDRLVRILRTLRSNLVDSGAEFIFGHTVTDIIVDAGAIAGVKMMRSAPSVAGRRGANEGGETSSEVKRDGELRASKVVFAVGHSARKLYERLLEHQVCIETKPIAVGFRVEHPQELINRIQFGQFGALCERGRGPVPVADYRLTAQVSDIASTGAGATESGNSQSNATRGVYSFCMCPGGQIVPTSVNPEELCINGMSFSQRQSKWANSALVVSVTPDDMVSATGEWAPDYPLRGVLWQEHFERAAASMGGGDLVAPVQRVTDFLVGQMSTPDEDTGSFSSSYRMGVRAAPLHELYPPFITAAVREALHTFNQRMPGFICPEAILHGVETRTSAPVQITRDRCTFECVSLKGLYPAGEGAGYAGGIVSAAVDGLRVGKAVCGEVSDAFRRGSFDVY